MELEDSFNQKDIKMQKLIDKWGRAILLDSKIFILSEIILHQRREKYINGMLNQDLKINK